MNTIYDKFSDVTIIPKIDTIKAQSTFKYFDSLWTPTPNKTDINTTKTDNNEPIILTNQQPEIVAKEPEKPEIIGKEPEIVAKPEIVAEPEIVKKSPEIVAKPEIAANAADNTTVSQRVSTPSTIKETSRRTPSARATATIKNWDFFAGKT